VTSLPIRFCPNVSLPNHFIVLLFYAMLLKMFRWKNAPRALAKRNPYVTAILEADIVADITGGDSFSDIYGMRRFITGFLRKWLIKAFGKKLVLLPQTYGPFKRRLSRILARHIINYASLLYSRDRAGVDYVKRLLGPAKSDEKVKLVPDVGFILDPRKPEHEEIRTLEKIKEARKTLVGLNVSGLLSGDGGNFFGLKIDYPALTQSIVELLMKRDNTVILLIPHVVSLEKPDNTPRTTLSRKRYREQSDTICSRPIQPQRNQVHNRSVRLFCRLADALLYRRTLPGHPRGRYCLQRQVLWGL